MPEDKKENFELILGNSSIVLARLKEIIENKEDLVLRQETDFSNYDAGWDYKQAYMNGLKAAYRELKQLVTLTKE